MINLEDNIPQIVPVSLLCNSEEKTRFFIPSYQRGYRWTESQIRYLLNDISNYDPSKDGNFYCLQPVVVHYDKDFKEGIRWRLIDGQQRLTTIFLIINTLFDTNQVFDIEFERGSHFPNFTDGTIKIDDSTSENYHLTMACNIIKQWGDENPEKKKIIEENLLKSENVRIIWYPIDKSFSNNKEFDFFMHMNSGKIQLTDSELVKALFLHDIKRGKDIEKTLVQTAMAEEWNLMETKLREPSFWYFIAGRSEMPDCAMDYLIEIHYKSHISETSKYAKYPYPAFAWLEDEMNGNLEGDIKNKKTLPDLWKELRKTFAIISGWFENTETYNLIGHLLTVNQPKSRLVFLLKEFRKKKMRKDRFISYLWNEAITKIIPEDDRKNILQDNVKELRIYEYRFDDHTKPKVFELLTLINIAIYTIGGMRRKFEFESYNNPDTPWNIEHISPQNPKDNKSLKNFIEKASKESDLPQEYQKLYDKLIEQNLISSKNPYDENVFRLEEEISEIRRKILPFDEDEVMKLGNLTLLTEHNNKSIGNKFFFEKRQVLKRKQAEGHYIPQLTQNVFTKWYSTKPHSPLLWEDTDRTDYLQGIANILKEILLYINAKNQQNESEGTIK